MTEQPLDDLKVANSAKRRIAIDFDETLVHWGALDELPEWKDGADEALTWFLQNGFEVIILTSRASRTWWVQHCMATDEDIEAFGLAQLSIVHASLSQHGFQGLLVTSEKLPCLYYIDDRAIRFTDWDSIMSNLTGDNSWR